MKSKPVLRVLVTLFLFSVAFPGQADDFSQTCTHLFLEGSRLTADCRRINQSQVPATLDLDRGIGNLDGRLAWGDRNFSHTCEDIRLHGAILKAECRRIDGSLNKTRLDLDERIDNSDGMLRFDR